MRKKQQKQSQGISAWTGPEYNEKTGEPVCRLCGEEMLWSQITDSISEYRCQNSKCSLYFKSQETSETPKTVDVANVTEHARQLLREKIMELNR